MWRLTAGDILTVFDQERKTLQSAGTADGNGAQVRRICQRVSGEEVKCEGSRNESAAVVGEGAL